MKITDNKKCLCVNRLENQDIGELIAECNKAEPEQKLLFLNRCNLINQYNYLDVMIVPEGVEEVLYQPERDYSFIKTLYLPSTVKKLQIEFCGAGFKKGHRLNVEISPENQFLVSKNGSVYTKDYKELVYFSAENKVEIDERCETIGHAVKFPVKRKFSILKHVKKIKTNGLYSKSGKIKLPEGIEKLEDKFLSILDFKKRPLFIIPSTVNFIGNCNKSKFCVSKANPVYASKDNCLYSKDFKTLWRGNKKRLLIKNGCSTVFTDDLLFESIKIPASVTSIKKTESIFANVSFDVAEENQIYASYKGSLYTKDYKKLIRLYVDKKSKKVFIHPSCSELDENYIPKRFYLLRGQKASEFEFIIPDYFKNDEFLNELKGRIFGRKTYYSLENIEKKNFTVEEIKRNFSQNDLSLNGACRLNREMIFTDDLKVVGSYFNPGQGEYIPVLCSQENIELIADEEHVELDIDGKFQVDCLLAKVISSLNAKGFRTTDCCSGHLAKSDFYWNEENTGEKVVAKILERKTVYSKAKGYIGFAEKYPEIIKLFPKQKSVLIKKLERLFGKKQPVKEPYFYFTDSKVNKKSMVLRFKYKPDKKHQEKAISILEEKLIKNL